MPETELPPGSGFAYDLGERILASQSAQVDAVDTKAAVILAVDGVIAGFLLRSPFHNAPRTAAIVASSSLLVSLISALLAFWTARYSTGPEFAAVAGRVRGSEAWIKWRFLPNLAEAIQANEVKLKRKNRLLVTALSALWCWFCMWADTCCTHCRELFLNGDTAWRRNGRGQARRSPSAD